MDLQQEIEKIKERNRRVELDKAWETSTFRIASILVITYIVTAIVFQAIGVTAPLKSALIPTIGFYLSTQSLSFLKNWWIKNHHQ